MWGHSTCHHSLKVKGYDGHLGKECRTLSASAHRMREGKTEWRNQTLEEWVMMML